MWVRISNEWGERVRVRGVRPPLSHPPITASIFSNGPVFCFIVAKLPTEGLSFVESTSDLLQLPGAW